MKKTIFALFTLCLLINSIYAQKNNIDINIPFSGKGTLVKFVEEDNSGSLMSSVIQEYDENANLIRHNLSYINYDGTFEYLFSYFNYNENDKIIEDYTVRPSIGDTAHKTYYKYNEHDKIIEEYYLSRTSSYGQKFVFNYDSLLRVSSIYCYDSIVNINKVLGALCFTKEDYHYHADGYTVESFSYMMDKDEINAFAIPANDSAYIKKLFEKLSSLNYAPSSTKYDNEGKVLNTYHPNGTSLLYTYNKNGDLIKHENYSDSITPPTVSEYRYTPKEGGIIKKDAYHDNDISYSIKYLKKNRAVMEYISYNEGGKRSTHWTNSYNERGDLSQSLNYENGSFCKKTTYTYKYGANAKAINNIERAPCCQ